MDSGWESNISRMVVNMSEYRVKDPAVSAYLQHLRDRNVEKASTCYVCQNPATSINSEGYSIFFVCDDHVIEKVRVIIDQSNAGVMHFTYPDGKDVPEAMMNPNLGGYIPRDGSVDYKSDIWETQVSFEE